MCIHIKLELSVPERSEGNGRWQIRALSVDTVSLFILKYFKNWFCWEVAFPSTTQRTTNIHYACFFSILRNYMQMTLRSINHIGFHFTNGWLYVNSWVLLCCFLHYFQLSATKGLPAPPQEVSAKTLMKPVSPLQLSVSQWRHLYQCPASIVVFGLLLTLGLQCDGSQKSKAPTQVQLSLKLCTKHFVHSSKFILPFPPLKENIALE